MPRTATIGQAAHDQHPPTAEQPVLKGKNIYLRPPGPDELAEIARTITSDPEASPWWGIDPDRTLEEIGDPSVTAFIIDAEGEAAGLIMFEEENDPDYRHASIDITLFTPWIGRGYGTDALRTLARYLFEVRGHHRLHIDPAASNVRAIRTYERVGFKPVGVMRRYERGVDGEWHDGLLMDLLAEELIG